jgi:hypothetical protein
LTMRRGEWAILNAPSFPTTNTAPWPIGKVLLNLAEPPVSPTQLMHRPDLLRVALLPTGNVSPISLEMTVSPTLLELRPDLMRIPLPIGGASPALRHPVLPRVVSQPIGNDSPIFLGPASCHPRGAKVWGALGDVLGSREPREQPKTLLLPSTNTPLPRRSLPLPP